MSTHAPFFVLDSTAAWMNLTPCAPSSTVGTSSAARSGARARGIDPPCGLLLPRVFDADLRAVMAEISEQAKVLDGIVRYRFGDNAELMGAWASAHNVAGPFRSRPEPQVGGGETPKAA
jgi:hypothetical protein